MLPGIHSKKAGAKAPAKGKSKFCVPYTALLAAEPTPANQTQCTNS